MKIPTVGLPATPTLAALLCIVPSTELKEVNKERKDLFPWKLRYDSGMQIKAN